MKQHIIKIGGSVNGKTFGPIPATVDRGETVEELSSLGFTTDEIVSHVNRDENSNAGNYARASLIAAVKKGEVDANDPVALAAECQKFVDQYESGETVKRTRGAGPTLSPAKIQAYMAELTADVAAKVVGAQAVSDAVQTAYAGMDFGSLNRALAAWHESQHPTPKAV